VAKHTNNLVEKPVDMDLGAEALAKAVCDGDIVNFNMLFAAFSPLRSSSTEILENEKYSYLLPDDAQRATESFSAALDAVRTAETWSHIQTELEAKRPVQLPSDLLLMLADNAVREEKYSVAAQAYELLRIRHKMLEEFLKQADAALDADDIPTGVSGYLIALGLSYDYAAFPEPLPGVLNYQSKALMLHGVYPTRPEDCVALQAEETHLNTALELLLVDEEISARLKTYPIEKRLKFLSELVSRLDPNWDSFRARFAEACLLTQSFGERLKRIAEPHAETLEEEIEEQQGADPREIMKTLLGREIENGEWWQYLKQLGYEHPAAVLFIARQLVGETEILMPRMLSGSSVPSALGLAGEGVNVSPPEDSIDTPIS